MANLTPKTIGEFSSASSLSDSDLFAVSSGGSSKKAAFSTLADAVKKKAPFIRVDTITMPTSVGNTLTAINTAGYSGYIVLGASVYSATNSRWETLPIGVDNGYAYLGTAGNNYRAFISSDTGLAMYGGQSCKIAVALY